MIDLNDNNDPMLFKASTAHGDLIVQYMEIVHSLQANGAQETNHSTERIVAAIRTVSRTPAVATACSDAVLYALWCRMSLAVHSAGNALGQPLAS